ncbi:MAG: mechanosensitive ion channel [Rhodobacteraceae bacterium]|nr:mechanosensitive ion channel [Paracoccaceae bacterium]
MKDIIHNFVAGAMVFLGTDLDEDDIIYISGRKARVSRCGWRKTIFYMYEGNTKMIVPNERLKNLTIEKRLPTNGGGQSKDYNN